MMKTYEEIKKGYIIEQRGTGDADLIYPTSNLHDLDYEEIAKRYAREALREGADNAKIKMNGHNRIIDKESITNIDLP